MPTIYDLVQEALNNAAAAQARLDEKQRLERLAEQERRRKLFIEIQKKAEKYSGHIFGRHRKIAAATWLQDGPSADSAIVYLFGEDGIYLRYVPKKTGYDAQYETLYLYVPPKYSSPTSTVDYISSYRQLVTGWDEFCILLEKYGPKKLT